MDSTAPDVYDGSYFDQANLVSDAEGLQDYRRAQEGHLIVADDRALLVMNYGKKYEGPSPSKYKIEGKYNIPCGYKVIVKWDEDEIVFMTRQGTFGPEFQIVYLPKSPVQEDFTLFEWNANIAEIWEQFLTVIEGKEDRDIRMFDQGPWRTFGVTRDEIQNALKMGTDNTTIVEGILYCADGQEPNLKEYMRYLEFDTDTDENYIWICQEFKAEPLPQNYQQHIKTNECMVYWVDRVTNEATWKHPHYDKYRKMLQVARTQKPVIFRTSIMAFRIEFLLANLFTWECEETGVYPLVETVENVNEMARIFGVDIKIEPYLVHVLKRALRHYGNTVKEKRKVKDVTDFYYLMERYRDLVGQFELAREREAKNVRKLKVCVECSESKEEDMQKPAVLFCDQCKDFFCQGCFDRLHAKGRRQNHRRTWVEMGMCEECGEEIAHFHCVQCADLYCRFCFQEWHARGGRRNHIPIVLRSFNSQAHILPEATPAMGSNIGQILDQARSAWFAFFDDNNIKFYHNIHSGTSRRDMPLSVINEPIEEGRGGGLSAGWAGSFGSNMFPDPMETSGTQTLDVSRI
jgi:hypothetical protein